MRTIVSRTALFSVLVAALFFGSPTASGEGAKSDSVSSPAPSRPAYTTVYVVRHAEQSVDGTRDPALSETGVRRASQLRDELKSSRLSAVFATPYRRSQGTALLTAEAYEIGIETYRPTAFDSLAARIRKDFMKKSVLVVGHSNTVPKIIETLGGPHYDDMAHDEFDKLFVLAVYADTTTCARLTYGDPFVPGHQP